VCESCYVLIDADAKELKALDLLHYSPVDVDEDVFSPDIKGEVLSWHHTVKSLTSSL
jgi:hypothetical protein